MMNKSILCAALWTLISVNAHAELQAVENYELAKIDGQASSAATIDWLLSLNQISQTNTTSGFLDTYSFDSSTCSDLRFCRFAMSLNNRVDAAGKKQWVVFKGVQGTIDLQQVQIDGTDLLYKNTSGVDQIKAALQVSFSEKYPIRIRNFGFSALAIETDTVANEGANNVPGYLAMGNGGSGVGAYAAGKYTNTTNAFDNGRETGFTGLTMNGNLALQGSLKIFSCTSDMSRC